MGLRIPLQNQYNYKHINRTNSLRSTVIARCRYNCKPVFIFVLFYGQAKTKQLYVHRLSKYNSQVRKNEIANTKIKQGTAPMTESR